MTVRVIEIPHGRRKGWYVVCKKEWLSGPLKQQSEAYEAKKEWIE